MNTSIESPVVVHLTCSFKEGKDKSKFFKSVQDNINNAINNKLHGHQTNINYLGYLEDSPEFGLHWHFAITYDKEVVHPGRLLAAIRKASKSYLTMFSLGREGIKEHHIKTGLVSAVESLCYITKCHTKELLVRKQNSTNIKQLKTRVANRDRIQYLSGSEW